MTGLDTNVLLRYLLADDAAQAARAARELERDDRFLIDGIVLCELGGGEDPVERDGDIAPRQTVARFQDPHRFLMGSSPASSPRWRRGRRPCSRREALAASP